MHVITTAGHVDHGKSTLVEALTGIDPDRLKEEKERGLTIDLGFAWMKLKDGREIGIVDVPGHERFIRNMLAGVGGVNAVVFVVDLTEGWQAQSQEHLDILDLLGISSGVVALTKADLATDVESVRKEVTERLRGTSLESSELIEVSSVTGLGIDRLREAIEKMVESTPPAPDLGRARLWVDRVFSMKGAGTVVTGTLIGGSLHEDQEVVILPRGMTARVRSIQSHKHKLEFLGPGNRAALNLVGASKEDLRRGDLVTIPGLWRPTRRFLAGIRFLGHLDHEPNEKGAYKVHTGSGEFDAAVKFLGPVAEEGSVAALLTLKQDLVLDFRDRFILRDVGRRETVAGGSVLEPHPDPNWNLGEAAAAAARRAQAETPIGYLVTLLGEGNYLSKPELRSRTGLSPEEAQTCGGLKLGDGVISALKFEELSSSLLEAVRVHQIQRPLDPGLPLTEARQMFDPEMLDLVADALVERGALVNENNVLRTPEHSFVPKGPEAQAVLDEVEKAGYSPPSLQELSDRFGGDLVRALVGSRDLVKVAGDLAFTAEAIRKVKDMVRQKVEGEGPFTVADFRDMLSTTRKYALPLLEYLDQNGFTRRKGDERELGPRA